MAAHVHDVGGENAPGVREENNIHMYVCMQR